MRVFGTAEAVVVAEGTPPYRAEGPKLLERVRSAMRTRHLSPRTEEVYVFWVRRYILFHGKRHPATLGPEALTRFLSSLAIERRVSASTQNQALSALLFLYRRVLGVELPWLDGLVRAKRPVHVPTVLSQNEVAAVLSQLTGSRWLMVALLYGAGLRLLECLRLRVKDVDFERNEILVHAGKGRRDRRTVLPLAVRGALASHLERVRHQHQADLRRGRDVWSFPTRSRGSTRTLEGRGPGSGCSPRPVATATRNPGSVAVITSTNPRCSAWCGRR